MFLCSTPDAGIYKIKTFVLDVASLVRKKCFRDAQRFLFSLPPHIQFTFSVNR